jgi:poly-gamma-glutamate capsule biosynthesis protein CapA/YwtB (metallophosphatase superfamily)
MRSVLPHSGRDHMAYPLLRQAFAKFIFRMADLLGIWRYPGDIDVEDLESFWRLAYWFYISEKPVVKAEEGSGLESFFARHQQPPDPLLPAGFQRESSVVLSVVGDLMCNRALDHAQGVFYERVADRVFDADVSMANLESTLTSGAIEETAFKPGELPKINATPAQWNVIKAHEERQYTVLQTANNHILDCGMEGFDTTHDVLDAEGFHYVGTNRSPEDATKGLILSIGDIKLGFVAATWGVNNRPFPDDKRYLVNLVRFHRHGGEVDLSLLTDQMAFCRSEGCDLVIACLHWGCEWEFYPRQAQMDQAHLLAESGAGLIIGHHAHVIQPVEWYRPQRDPDRVVPILYGLGNLSPICWVSHTVLSLIARVQIAVGLVDGVRKTMIERVDLTPVVQMEFDRAGRRCARLDVLADLIRQATDEEVRSYVEQIAGYADLVLGKGWRNE